MFERGALLLVPFPFSDLSATKRRPVLALTGPDSYGDFIALPITSRLPADNYLLLRSADLSAGSLPVTSYIRTDRIVTLSASLVVKSFGQAGDHILAEAIERFCAKIRFTGR